MLLRVIISENDIRCLSIENIPPSVKELCQVLQTNLGLRGGFILQFEDPEFNHQLCNLTDIKDLPLERATLKVLFTADEPVEKHPSLKEPGPGKGWYSWFHSLKFKLGNYRQKLSAAGCPEVVINKGKGGDSKGKRMKKSKKGEVNYCPDPPEGQSHENIEEKRKLMVVEMLKKDPDHQLVEHLMTTTFSQRRKEIIGDQPLVAEVLSRWPALFLERQIRAEFKRVVTTDLLESFLNGLDDLVPKLLEVYKAATKSGKKQTLKDMLNCLEKNDTNERRRTAALLGLAHYISEDPSDVIRMCDAHGETLDAAMKGMTVGLLIGYESGEQDPFPRTIFNVAVVVEETIVLHDLKDVPCAFAMLMGIVYSLNLEYPQGMKYTFEFLQRVLMKIQPDQASAKVNGLRNKVLSYNLLKKRTH